MGGARSGTGSHPTLSDDRETSGKSQPFGGRPPPVSSEKHIRVQANRRGNDQRVGQWQCTAMTLPQGGGNDRSLGVQILDVQREPCYVLEDPSNR